MRQPDEIIEGGLPEGDKTDGEAAKKVCRLLAEGDYDELDISRYLGDAKEAGIIKGVTKAEKLVKRYRKKRSSVQAG